MSSLEGLNSLIQLESTRLEGAKQTTQNFQSVGSTVQQQGIQTAQSRMNMTIQRIDAQYSKEVAMADVRKLERRLARERAAEALAKNIACIATISNAVGNLGHLFNDLNGRQKLGDTPDYLKSPPLKPEGTKVSITTLPTGANTVYLSGQNKGDDSETVYRYDTGKGGDTVSSMPIAATITEYDKKRILGDEYPKMIDDYNKKNGTNLTSLTFDQIHQMNPDLADHLVQTRGHGISKDEAENLMAISDIALSSDIRRATPTSTQIKFQGSQDASKLAAVYAITNKDNPDMSAGQIAEISKIASANLSSEQKVKIFGEANKDKSLDELLKDKSNQKKLFADPDFMKKLEFQAKPNPDLSSAFDKLNNKGKEAKFTDKEITELEATLTIADKERIFGNDNKDKPLKELLQTPANIEKLSKDSVVKENIETLIKPKSTEYLVQRNENGHESVQYSDNGINFMINDISPDDKEKILGKEFRDKPFNEIQNINPNGQELARKLLSGVLEKDFNNMSVDKKESFLKKYPEIMKDKPNKDRFDKLDNKTQKGLKDKYGFDGNNFDSLQADKREALKKEHPELFFDSNGMLSNLIANKPVVANDAVKDFASISGSKNIKPLSSVEAKSNTDRAGLMRNVDTSRKSLRDYLAQTGKIDDRSTLDKLKEAGKHGVNFLVKTMNESTPYFQAYLKMKEQADKTYEELQAAIDKLNAASKKLRKLEMQIDEFSGRGA